MRLIICVMYIKGTEVVSEAIIEEESMYLMLVHLDVRKINKMNFESF